MILICSIGIMVVGFIYIAIDEKIKNKNKEAHMTNYQVGYVAEKVNSNPADLTEVKPYCNELAPEEPYITYKKKGVKFITDLKRKPMDFEKFKIGIKKTWKQILEDRVI